MKKAVMYGAGNIGRGFIGKTFSESGYEVCFIDVNEQIVDKMNLDLCYPVKIVTQDKSEEVTVSHIRAVNGMDTDRVADEIAACDIMATAVGVNVLPRIIKPICEGLKKRFESNVKPLNIIICENLIDADAYLRKMIESELGSDFKDLLDAKLGLVEASIGRMVPVMTDELREGNILRVCVEPYDKLPVDKDAFIGEVPKINGFVPFSPFGYYIKRKLYIHNLGHAICAYMGWQKNYQYIYECVADAKIYSLAKEAMRETALSLQKEYGITVQELNDHIEDLLSRFANRALGDTVARVGRDPIRKTEKNDRLIGAALYCLSQGIEPVHVIEGIVSVLQYDNEEDEFAALMQKEIKQKGIKEYLISHSGLDHNSAILEAIIESYQSTSK